MKNRILGFVMGMLMMSGTALASDVYITQSGATFTANINQDGLTNRYGVSGTVATHTGDNQTLDIDQIGNTNTIAATVVGATQTFTLRQAGNSNTSTVSVGANSASADNSIIQTITGNSNATTVNVAATAAGDDADVDLVLTGDSNTVTIHELSLIHI